MVSALEKKLLVYAQNNLNVMLVGSHGIGKTTVTKNIAQQLNLKFKYYSSSTLDPFADIVGIPVPDKENKTLDFYKPKDIQEAEFIFFDELNRAHPRVLNAVLEIIQFKTVNGERLKNLKMVWAAVNPPGEDYQVEELDPALIDRFHVFVKMKPEINKKYLSSVLPASLVKTLADWWNESLGDDQRRIFTPRRLEYLGMMITKKIPWRDCFPQGHTFPADDLQKRLNVLDNPDAVVLEVSKENLLKHPEKFVEAFKTNPEYAIPLSNFIKMFDDNQMYSCRDVLELLPTELISKIAEMRFPARRKVFWKLLIEKKVDITKYPNIHRFFNEVDDSAEVSIKP